MEENDAEEITETWLGPDEISLKIVGMEVYGRV